MQERRPGAPAQARAIAPGEYADDGSASCTLGFVLDVPYVDGLRVLLAAPEVDALLFMHAPTAIVPAADIAAACLPLAGCGNKGELVRPAPPATE